MKKHLLSLLILILFKVSFSQEITWGPTYESIEKNHKEVNYNNGYEVQFNPDADFEYLEYNKVEGYFSVLYKEKYKGNNKFYIHKYSLKDYSLINKTELMLSSLNEKTFYIHKVVFHNNLIYAFCSSYNSKTQDRTYYYQTINSNFLISKPTVLFKENTEVQDEYYLDYLNVIQSKNKQFLTVFYAVSLEGDNYLTYKMKFYNGDMKLYNENTYSFVKIKEANAGIKVSGTYPPENVILDNNGILHLLVKYKYKTKTGFDEQMNYLRYTSKGVEILGLNDKGKNLINTEILEGINNNIYLISPFSYTNTSEEFLSKKAKINVTYGLFICSSSTENNSIASKIIPIEELNSEKYKVDYSALKYTKNTSYSGLDFVLTQQENNQNIYISLEQQGITFANAHVQNQFVIKLDHQLNKEWTQVIQKKQASKYYWQPFSSFNYIFNEKMHVYQNEPLKESSKGNEIIELNEYGNYPILTTIYNTDGNKTSKLDETLMPKGLTLVPLRCKKFDDGVIFYAEDIGNKFCFGGLKF